MEKIKAESLEHARQQIDAIDTALVELIAARQFYVDQTTRFKKTETDLQSPERMEQIVENVRALAQKQGLDQEGLIGIRQRVELQDRALAKQGIEGRWPGHVQHSAKLAKAEHAKRS